jgi:hypothetical protein
MRPIHMVVCKDIAVWIHNNSRTEAVLTFGLRSGRLIIKLIAEELPKERVAEQAGTIVLLLDQLRRRNIHYRR